VIQHFPDLRGQLSGRERLDQHVIVLLTLQALERLDERFPRVTGGIEHLEIVPELARQVHEFRPLQFRHDHIAEDEVNAFRVGAHDLQPGHAIRHGDDLVPEGVQDAAGEDAQDFIVFNDEHGFGARGDVFAPGEIADDGGEAHFGTAGSFRFGLSLPILYRIT